MKSDNTSISQPPALTQAHVAALYQLAATAGEAILAIYRDESLWQMNNKVDDTPVTAADLQSSDILVRGLPDILSCPVISEEALPTYRERSQWQTYWLVDPMDGTREFLHKTDEFVINIALMSNHQPIFGFMYQPTTGDAWWGGEGFGAFAGRPESPLALPVADCQSALVALGSRRSRWKGEWRERLQSAGYSVTTQSVGSALKFARLAEGQADLYPRLGPTCEWDTAAPQAILQVTGGAIRQWNGVPLEYGKRNMLNPHFVAVRDTNLLAALIDPD